MRGYFFFFVLAVTGAAVACGSSSGSNGGPDSGTDAKGHDGSPADGGGDSRHPGDSGKHDSGKGDGGSDGGPHEAGPDGGLIEGGDGGTNVFCSETTAGVPYCFGYENYPPTLVSGFETTCTTTDKGTVISSCPSAGLVGCCTIQGTNTVVSCDYSGTASADQGMCTGLSGTWSTSAPP
jgi:hypothetical protein